MRDAEAVVYALFSTTLIAFATALSKSLFAVVPLLVLIFSQYFVPTVVSVVRRRSWGGMPPRPLALLGRVGVMLFGIYLFLVAATQGGLATAVALFMVNPVFTMILHRWIFRTPVTRSDLVYSAMSFVGVVLLTRATGFAPVSLWALVAAGLVAVRSVIDRALMRDYGSVMAYQLDVCRMATVVLLVVCGALVDWDAILPDQIWTLGVVSAWGALILFTFTAQFVILHLVAQGQIMTFAVLSYWEIVVGAVLGGLIFHEPVSVIQGVGLVLILSAGVGRALRALRHAPQLT